MSEQELFGLMAVAQEQQQAATSTLQKLEAQQAELAGIIGKARSAVEAMNNAGTASAVLIEKATKNAVEKGVHSALERISEQAKLSLADAINPAVKPFMASRRVLLRLRKASGIPRARSAGSGHPCVLLPPAHCCSRCGVWRGC